MIKFLLLLIVISSYKTLAQTDAYQFSADIVDKIETQTEADPDMRNYYLQEGAWKFSFIGDYKKLLKYWDEQMQEAPQTSKEDSTYFKSLKAYPAKDYIIKRANDEQIVLLNEAHHIPLHRVFAASLLEDLYDLGYKYLGVEAYNYEDTLLKTRGFPIQETGYYTQEPQFGNFIRTALDLGFKVFAYEAGADYNGKEREIQQAKNIQKILKEDPKAKLFIYAGYDHIREDSLFNSWEKAMAGWLKEYTGIDPLTINQEVMTEKSHSKFENPFFRVSNENVPVVYMDSLGQPFNGSLSSAQYDVNIFHSRTNYIQGRPDWLLLNGKRLYSIREDQIDIDCPCLVFAYKTNEPENAVPIDIMELNEKNEQKALALPVGTFKIILKNKQGKRSAFQIDIR